MGRISGTTSDLDVFLLEAMSGNDAAWARAAASKPPMDDRVTSGIRGRADSACNFSCDFYWPVTAGRAVFSALPGVIFTETVCPNNYNQNNGADTPYRGSFFPSKHVIYIVIAGAARA